MKSKKFIDFIITQKCNYKCPYCSQSKSVQHEYSEASNGTIKNFIKFLDKIDRDYEITITGGEAVLHPDFSYLINQVKSKGFKINLITNFSFDFDIYKKIFDDLNLSLNRFDISFHFCGIKDFEKTVIKLEQLLLYKPESTIFTFHIPIYKLDTKIEEKIEILKIIAEKNGINLNFQHIRMLNKFVKYNENEIKYFKNEKITKSYGKLCYAGKNSAIIYENGNVYRCYSSRLNFSNYLGNINDENFSLAKLKKPCIHKYCTCKKPELYNQITDEKDLIGAGFTRLKNYIRLPYLIFKNSKLIGTKLRHCFKNIFNDKL